MSNHAASTTADCPRVSVIVPAYNATGTLAKTLASIAQQTEPHFEVIIINDGSTDGTLAMAEDWARRDPRFSVRSQVNQGIAAARNHGIHSARAPLVAPLDADDLWHPTYLEKLCDALEQAGDDTLFVYANFRTVDMNDRVAGTAPVYGIDGSTRNRFLLCNFVGNGSGMIFRRDAALTVGGYDGRLQHQYSAQGCEDWLLQTQLSAIGRVAVVKEYLVGYRQTPNNMSQNVLRMRLSRFYAVKLLLETASDYHPTTVRWALGSAAAHCFLAHWRARNWGPALEWAGVAARDDIRALGANLRELCYSRMRKYYRRVRPKPLVPDSALPPRRPFYELAPTEGQKPPQQDRLFRRVLRAGGWDAALEQTPAPMTYRVVNRGGVAPAEQLSQSRS